MLKLVGYIDSTDGLELSKVYHWTPADDTRIVLCCIASAQSTADYENAFLIYLNEPRVLESLGAYNTNGL